MKLPRPIQGGLGLRQLTSHPALNVQLGPMMNIYEVLFWTYLIAALGTLAPIVVKTVRGVALNPGGASFESSPHFSEDNKKRLSEHYSRLTGTLEFWKKRAAIFTSFHYYCINWTIFSSWAAPIIASISPDLLNETNFSKLLIILASSHVALALSFHRGLKVAEGMKAFRHGESQFYDLYRRLLDRPETLGQNENAQIEKYISEVERIRKFVRNAETDRLPTVEDLNATG